MRIFKFFLFFVTLLLVAFPIGIGMADTSVISKDTLDENNAYISAEHAERINNLLQDRLIKSGFKGTALVAYKDQIITEYANGYSDYSEKKLIKENSSFQLASVSKSFTATAIMIIHEQGHLKYDDKVVQYIPEFPYEKITIRHLLQHTSGLPNYMYLVDQYWKNDSLISNEDVLDLLIEHQVKTNYVPGSRFVYSNTGYAMLALLVERVSHQSFSSFLSQYIFEPAQMNSTFTYNKNILDTLDNRVLGYGRSGKRLRQYEYEPNDLVLGDKSVFSNVYDLFNYLQYLNSYKIVSEESLAQAYTRGTTVSKKSRDFDYGFGWRMRDEEGMNLIYHNGLWHGFSSTLTREINNDITVILLSNTAATISGIRNELLQISINELQKISLEKMASKTGVLARTKPENTTHKF